MTQSNQNNGNGLIEGINVTPLVDIVLVLLIIFIVTAKLVVNPAVPLDLPKAATSEELQSIFAVTVTAAGDILVDGQPCPEASLRAKCEAALKRDPELRAVIQADKAVPHGRVMYVLDTLKAAGLSRVAFGALRPPAPAGATGHGARAAPANAP